MDGELFELGTVVFGLCAADVDIIVAWTFCVEVVSVAIVGCVQLVATDFNVSLIGA